MSFTDPIADLLTRIRNALHAERDVVELPSSRFKVEVARILREQGYIEGYRTEAARVGQTLHIDLKYTDDRRSVISSLRRVSRPGRRTYVGAREVPRVLGGMGTAIISTSQGVMTGHEARRAGVGGEVVAYIV
ncbi:30S ribosomal protein S8 [soil metagenome]|jgi:small subunit ribosomal protein S8|nr:30S ribosomal protein S8 [Thermoleophilaceae bacterium]MDQ3240420.1 30S ribosomal protein S8 [Actinomycetota bacterium]MDQ3356732.1 30S ribosomal protein S8 [Actinomycetota bacterium]